MAPFFKSSSLFNISRRRRKDQKSLDTAVSSKPTFQSRSLPNMEELHGISSRFLEEFRPILQPQLVSDSEKHSPKLIDQSATVSSESNPPKQDDASILAVPSSDPEPTSPSEINSSQLNEQPTPRLSPSCNQENSLTVQDDDLPKVDEESTPRAAPSTTFEAVSSSENASIELHQQSTPRPEGFNNLEIISSSESCSRKSDEQIPLSAPLPSPESGPSSESNQSKLGGEPTSQAGDFVSSSAPIPSTNCKSPVEQGVPSGESPVTADSNKSVIELPNITHLNPRKSVEASRRNTVKTASDREDECAKFLQELDDFAVFFGVEKPSKTASLPPLVTQTKLDCSPKSDMPSRPTANDCNHKSDCDHEKIMEMYNDQIERLDQKIERLEKDISDANEEKSILRETMTEEFSQLQNKYHAEWNMNVKLRRALNNIKFDHLKVLGRQDWEINQMKRFIGAMIDIKLHAPVLFNAAYNVCNGGNADAALVAAIKEAATRFDSPWFTILPAIVGDRPQEIYLDAIKRCAKLEGNLREATKKYQFWKMKAQMDPHAKLVTPSSSSMSLVLDAYLPKETLELNCIDNLLSKLETGKVTRHSQPPAPSSPEIAGLSKFEGAYVAPSSPTHTSEGPSENAPYGAPVASSLVFIPKPKMESEVPDPSSPVFAPEESSQDMSSEVPVASSHIVIPEETSEFVVLPRMESAQASPAIMPSPALSGHSSFTREAPARVIRHYIPGRTLFGEDGLGIAPPGLFDRHENDELPGSPALSVGGSPGPGLVETFSVSMVRNYVVDHIEHVSYSQESLGLEYIDEIPVDGRVNPILRSDSDNDLISEKRKEISASEPPKGGDKPNELPNSASKKSFSSLQRLSASSSKLRQSISSGLKRLRRISFASNKAEQAENPTSAISRHKTIQTHRRMASAAGKENRLPSSKYSSTITRSSIPRRGIRRPTVSSALKTVQVSPLPTPTVISNTPAGKRAPLSNIPVRLNNSQKANTNAPRKVLDQGRRAVRTLARLIY